MIKPQRAVVLSPEKSLRFQISLDLSRIVPVSMGANDSLEWVNAPAALKSFEKYFLGLGRYLQPEEIWINTHKITKENNFSANFGIIIIWWIDKNSADESNDFYDEFYVEQSYVRQYCEFDYD